MAYKSPFNDWHLYRRPRGRAELPPGTRARIDVTDRAGHVLHQEHVGSNPKDRKRVYDWAREKYGPGNYFIFYSALGATDAPAEDAA